MNAFRKELSMLNGKIIWITGAGTGIGLAGAQALAQAGATVVMSGRREAVLTYEAGQIAAADGSAEVEPLDVSDPEAVQRVADAIVQRHGTIDILVNSAGLNSPKRFWRDMSTGDWDRVIRVNLDGTFYCTRAVLPHMRQKREGLVINISSWAGRYPSAITGRPTAAASTQWSP